MVARKIRDYICWGCTCEATCAANAERVRCEMTRTF